MHCLKQQLFRILLHNAVVSIFIAGLSLNSEAMSPGVNLLLNSTDKVVLVKKFDGEFLTYPFPPVLFDGQLWFAGSDAKHGMELWRSDGTPDGTLMTADIDPGPQGSVPLFMKVFNNGLYFVAHDGSNGFELRKTYWDSSLGDYRTILLKDIYPGAENGFEISLASSNLVEFRGKLFFEARDDKYGEEVWMTDGTSAGTVRVTDINPGAGDASPEFLTVFDTTMNNPSSLYGDILLFSADNGSSGKELWRIQRSPILPFNFTSNLVRDINSTVGKGSSPKPLASSTFSLYQGDLYFSADNDVNGRELWKTGGSSGDTTLVKDIDSSSDNSIQSTTFGTAIYENELYFAASSGDNVDLWKTDGTAGGTLQAFSAGLLGEAVTFINFVHNGGLFFSTVTEISPEENIIAFWKRYWDETSLSWQAKNIASLITYPDIFSFLKVNIAVNDKIYFSGIESYSGSDSVYGIYRLNSDDRVKKIYRGITLPKSEIQTGYTEYNNWVYLFGVDEEGYMMLLKLLPE